MKKENTFNCLSCGSNGHPEPFLQSCADYYLGTASKVDYFKCSECGLVQLSPIPEDVSAFYEAYPIHATKSKLHTWLRKLVMAPAYLDPRLLKRGAILLDYGCGDGWFLDSCKDQRLSLLGFERSAAVAENLSRRLKVPIYSDLERLIADFQAKVDVITMHFVVEHLTDVAGAFRHVESLLKPGGIFFFTVPNVDSWEATLFGKKWHCLDPPRHISFLNRAVVERLAARHGLEVTQIRSVPFPNGFAGSIPCVIIGHFNFILYCLALPCGILISRLAPAGMCSYILRRT
jgi:SAM-dependent methyltransferase